MRGLHPRPGSPAHSWRGGGTRLPGTVGGSSSLHPCSRPLPPSTRRMRSAKLPAATPLLCHWCTTSTAAARQQARREGAVLAGRWQRPLGGAGCHGFQGRLPSPCRAGTRRAEPGGRPRAERARRDGGAAWQKAVRRLNLASCWRAPALPGQPQRQTSAQYCCDQA